MHIGILATRTEFRTAYGTSAGRMVARVSGPVLANTRYRQPAVYVVCTYTPGTLARRMVDLTVTIIIIYK